MSQEITREDDPQAWNDLVEQSPQATPFHRFEALEVMASHTRTELVPYVAYKGQEPVGLCPIFVVSRGPATAAFSPPPDIEISYLGPALLNHEKAKQRTAEKRHRRFVDGVVSSLRDEVGPAYVHVRTSPAYADVRPFVWNDYRAGLRYTYEVDLTRPADELFDLFSSDFRQNVRGTDDDNYELAETGREDIEQIIEMLEERHETQDVAFNVSVEFARGLYDALPEDTMRVYACRSGEAFVGGMLTLEDDRTLYRWQAINDADHEVPAADLLDWHVIREGCGRDVARFDLVGANNERICGYKAKFNPRVVPFYTLERSSLVADGLKTVYSRLRASGSVFTQKG